MPGGSRCPHCGRPVMSFGRFLREAEPTRTLRCQYCCLELRRNKAVWWLLGAGTAVLVPGVGLGLPFAFERFGATGASAFVLFATGVGVFSLKVCGWLFVGWDPAGQGDSQPVASQPN